MTDLLAAGGGLPLALQIPNVVEQVGAIAGFASVIGLAILSALYFSQARDVRRLREWAGRAPERAAEMAAMGQAPPTPVPGRVVATPQRPAQAVKPGPATPGAAVKPGPAAGAAAAGAQANGDAAPTVAKEGDKAAPVPAGQAAGDAKDVATPGEADAAKPGDADAAKAAEGAAAAEPAKDGETAPAAKPGMPAPASAAAAAGATAAAGAAPAAPTQTPGAAPAPGAPKPEQPKSGPVAQPQRTPGSVLPPRTGTMPPVRRPPGAPAGRPGAQAQPSVLGPAGQAPPKEKRNPLYVALAVIGVLLVGGAAAVAVPALVDGTEDETPKAADTERTTKKKATPVKPDAITVAVLNGTGIPGLAAQVGDQVDGEGFTLGTVSNASQTQGQRANSVAMYSKGHERDARTVARRLRIQNVQPVDADSQSIAGDASVVVIVGSDKTQ